MTAALIAAFIGCLIVPVLIGLLRAAAPWLKRMIIGLGGFTWLVLQTGALMWIIGMLTTQPPSPGIAILAAFCGALMLIANAWLALHIAQRLMLMDLWLKLRHKDPRDVLYRGAPQHPWRRVNWKEYRG